ncbi:MAG: AmmeMemoRadiSam system radical SAM enzyme, partial [Pseudomonadota bacterium]
TSSAVDPIEKKPLFHFLPGSYSYSVATSGCNLRCPWCQNHDLSQAPRRLIPPNACGAWTPPEKIVSMALKRKCSSMSFTYSEPTIFYEYARDIGVLARSKGLKNGFVTNGMMTPEVIADAKAFLDAANVDLKGATKKFYARFCKGSIDAVMESIGAMHEAGIWVEVTTLVIPGHNDSDRDLRFIAGFLAGVSPDLPWHISRFHPDNEWLSLPPTPVSTLKRAAHIAREAGLNYVYIGNVRGEGFEDTRCPECGNLQIKRCGFMADVKGVREGRCSKCDAPVPGVWGGS